MLTGKGYPAANQFSIPFHNIKSKARTLHIPRIACAEEAVEHVLLIFVGNTNSFVSNDKLYPPVTPLARDVNTLSWI